MTSFQSLLSKTFTTLSRWLFILTLSIGVVRGSDADPGTYPLKLNGYYPDALLLNADHFQPKMLQDLYPGALMQDTDLYLSERRKEIKDLGVTPFLYYWGDYLANPIGGVKQSAVWDQLLVFGAKIHLDRLIGWEGGTLVVSFSEAAGNDLSRSMNNIFNPSQALSIPTFASNALYLRQLLLGEKLEIRLGRFSSASAFASLPAMGSLPVSAAVNGTPTSLFTNLKGWHATGKPSWAAYAKVEPAQDTYVKAAVLEVNPQANDVNYHGFDMAMGPHDGTLLLTECGWTPKFEGASSQLKGASIQDSGYPGIYMAGAYLQNDAQTQFNGQTCNEIYGFYWQAQQMVWRASSHPKQNLSLWGGVTYSPQTQVALLPVMGYAGIYSQGLIPSRERDVAMLNFYTASISPASSPQSASVPKATQENEIELSYIIQLTDHFQLQPDLQWIIQPGGYSGAANSLVVGFQVAAQF